MVIDRELILKRIPPGDRWAFSSESGMTESIIFPTLTDALEAFFEKNGKCDFYLAPLDSKVYKIVESEPKPEPIKKYSLYDE